MSERSNRGNIWLPRENICWRIHIDSIGFQSACALRQEFANDELESQKDTQGFGTKVLETVLGPHRK